jgi:hypothetical protein
MPMVTPTLNLPPIGSSASTKTSAPAPAPAAAPAPRAPDPSTTVTLSPQAMTAVGASVAAAAPTAAESSVYESLQHGISTAVIDVGDAIAGGAHAVVDGLETTLSMANKVAKGILELPFAALSKASDAVGALIDEL